MRDEKGETEIEKIERKGEKKGMYIGNFTKRVWEEPTERQQQVVAGVWAVTTVMAQNVGDKYVNPRMGMSRSKSLEREVPLAWLLECVIPLWRAQVRSPAGKEWEFNSLTD